MALHEHYTYSHQGDPTDALVDLFWVHTIDMDPKFYKSMVVETKDDPLEKIQLKKPEWPVLVKWEHTSTQPGAFSGRLFRVQVGDGDNKDTVWVATFVGSSKYVNIRLISAHEDAALQVWDILNDLDPIDVIKGNKVKVTFWWRSSFPTSRPRHLEIVDWASIRNNYSTRPDAKGISCTDKIDDLIKFRPDPDFVGGKLALFHGAAGTGKTTLIRAVAKDWSEWCDVEYITDPEKFFGDASYMIHVLMEDAQDDPPVHEGGGPPPKPPRWRLVVLEDSGDFLSKTQDDAVNQSLSRLLNLSDGLMGQGLRVLTLLTTNQKLNEIHPAVTRPGRCLAEIEVPKLTKAEAALWLGPEWKGKAPTKAMTLAELYLEKSGDDHMVTVRPEVGTGQYL